MALRRLKKDLKTIEKDSDKLGGITASPMEIKRLSEDGETIISPNMFMWRAIIVGPKDTPYENGLFNLELKFPVEYPFKPPTVRFITKIYHPNINSDGAICVSILKSDWTPAIDTAKLLLSISSLLGEPNPHDPLDENVANMYLKDREQYNETARYWTQKYAS